jgi:penicillin-binding protein 1A
VTDQNGQVLEEITTPQVPIFNTATSAINLTAVAAEGAVKAPDAPAPVNAPETGNLTPVPVISRETSYIMTNLMESVVMSGTGQRAKAVGRPVAGKTGTTNDMKDAWFVGYVPQLVAGVWVGYDQEKSLGASGSGGQAAAPIWTDFMKRALSGKPVEDFVPPPNVTLALINPRTGHLARQGSEGSVMECFISGTEPTTYDGDTIKTGPLE